MFAGKFVVLFEILPLYFSIYLLDLKINLNYSKLVFFGEIATTINKNTKFKLKIAII